MKDIKLWEDDDGFLVAFNADGSSFKMFYKKADTVPDAFQLYFQTLSESYPNQKAEFLLK